MIQLKSPREIETMAAGGRILAATHRHIRAALAPGSTTLEIDAMVDGVWKTMGKATSIGACRIVRFERPVTTKRCRIRITGSQACAVLGELGMFLKN